MDITRLSEYCDLIKKQFASREYLLEYHSKIEALIELILTRDLLLYPISKLHDCLGIIADLIGNAKTLNEEAIGSLAEISASLIDLKEPSLE